MSSQSQSLIDQLNHQIVHSHQKEEPKEANPQAQISQETTQVEEDKKLNEYQQNQNSSHPIENEVGQKAEEKLYNETPLEPKPNQAELALEYYKQIIGKRQPKNFFQAQKYQKRIQSSIHDAMQYGLMELQQKSFEIKDLLHDSKFNDEELRRLEKKAQLGLKNQKIKLLDIHHSPGKDEKSNNQQHSAEKLITFKSVLTKEQHSRIVERFMTESKERQKKHNLKIKMFEKQQKEHIEKERQRLEEERRLRSQEKRKVIFSKLQKHKEEHKKFIDLERRSTQQYKAMKSKKFLYQQREEQYKSEVVIPLLQEKKAQLKSIREFNRQYDLDAVKRHERQYIQRKSLNQSMDSSKHKIENHHYSPPEKAHRLAELLEQERMEVRIRYESKRKLYEQNKVRQANFLSEVRIKHKPKVDEKKKEELQNRLKSEEIRRLSKVRKEVNRVEMGARHFQEAKKMGRAKKPIKQRTEGSDFIRTSEDLGEGLNQFLMAKKGDKNITVKTTKKKSLPQNKIQSGKRSSNSSSTYLGVKRGIDIHESRRRQMRKVMNSDEWKTQEKLQRLKMENERINEAYRMKQLFFKLNEDDEKVREQSVNLLLDSIQAKIGIIDVCSKK